MRNAVKSEIQNNTVAPKLGSIILKKGSKKLYFDFYYYGKRVTKTTRLDDTPGNRRKVEEILNRWFGYIERGDFCFAKAFPGASDDEKEFFSKLEGRDYSADPKSVLFGDYLDRWEKDILELFPSDGKKSDYKKILTARIRPYFGDMTFKQITPVELKKFVGQLRYRDGVKQGEQLSWSRVRNVLIPLRSIWKDACDEYDWDIRDPFRSVSEVMPQKSKKPLQVFRFSEWQKILDNIDDFYKPVVEVMVMTGMIASEIAGLRKEDIDGECIHVQNSIVKGKEKDKLKTEYRIRDFPITDALRKQLNILIERTDGNHLVTMRSGIPFDGDNFRKNIWRKAIEGAGLSGRVPYVMRHSFAAWSLLMKIDQNKLVNLMGHGSKQMVYEVYGKYVKGLECDRAAIEQYFGTDFVGSIGGQSTSTLTKFGESLGKVEVLTCVTI